MIEIKRPEVSDIILAKIHVALEVWTYNYISLVYRSLQKIQVYNG